MLNTRSDDALLLALPWELLHHNDAFLVREGKLNLLRTTTTEAAGSRMPAAHRQALTFQMVPEPLTEGTDEPFRFDLIERLLPLGEVV